MEDPDTTLEALATFTTQAFRRLRQRSLATGGIWVFLAGQPYKGDSCSIRAHSDVLRQEWSDAPEADFVGADPLRRTDAT